MARKTSPAPPKRYSVAEANATLPLVRRIVQDITELAHELRDRHQRLERITAPKRGKTTLAHSEEVEQLQAELERDGARLQGYVEELKALGVELKDYFMGLVDFRCWMDGREVYLCWKLGEPDIAYWHDLDAGFRGRQPLVPEASKV